MLAPAAASSPSGKVWFVHVPRAAAVRGPLSAFLVSVHAEMCTRPDGSTAARWENPMRITLPHAPGVMGSPVFRGNRKPLSLVQRPGTSARIASTGRCGRLEDSQDATTLPRPCLSQFLQDVSKQFEKKPLFTNRLALFRAHSKRVPKSPRHKTGTKRHKNFGARPVSFIDKAECIADAASSNAALPWTSWLRLLDPRHDRSCCYPSTPLSSSKSQANSATIFCT